MLTFYKVTALLEDTAEPGAPDAYGPVILTFKVRGVSLKNAMTNAEKALEQISKIPGEIEKIELSSET